MSLEQIYRRALAGVDPFPSTKKALRRYRHLSRVEVMAAGKAAVSMVRAVLEELEVSRGILVTKDGHLDGFEAPEFTTLEASHPVPDRRTLEAGRRFLDFAAQSREPVIFCLSGGASALLEAPVEGLSLEQLQELSRQLLSCGAAIEEINLVRKHLSRIKGGHLGRALTHVPLVTLLLSDVVGAGPEMIGSGPTLGDPTSVAEAVEVLARYGLSLPKGVEFVPTPGHVPGEWLTVADNRSFVQAASQAAQPAWRTRVWEEPLQGSVEAGARRLLAEAGRMEDGELLVAGGELTLEIPTGSGLGGRCQHLALLLARELRGTGLRALVGASDGTDGPTDAAGAMVDGKTWQESAQSALDNFDSYHFFQRHGGALMTGPTGTNVNDLVLIGAGRGPEKTKID